MPTIMPLSHQHLNKCAVATKVTHYIEMTY